MAELIANNNRNDMPRKQAIKKRPVRHASHRSSSVQETHTHTIDISNTINNNKIVVTLPNENTVPQPWIGPSAKVKENTSNKVM